MSQNFDVAGYLQAKGYNLKPAGGSEFHLACFFHGEDSGDRGRLYVNCDPGAEILGLFECKVCGERGALPTLMRWHGDEVPWKKDDPDENSEARLEILRVAAAFYHEALGDNEDVFAYLRSEERMLTSDTIMRHQIGYAADEIDQDLGNDTITKRPSRALYRHLRDLGFTTKDILDTGLITKNRDDRIIDSLSGMITIPYRVAGNVVQIRGRAWPYSKEDKKPKYKTCGGNTSRLFNTDAVWENTELVVTEGEFDAMVIEQLGFPAVGVPGAKGWQDAWDGYVKDLRRIWLVFDRDAAGEQGAQKISARFPGKIRRIYLSPEGFKVDPTQWVANGNGRDEFEYLIDEAKKAGLLVTVDQAIEEHGQYQGVPGIQFGVELLDLAINPGLQAGQLAIVLAKTGTGKAQRVDQPVATPNGWVKIGDLRLGDRVFGSDGKPTTVTGVYPQGLRSMWEVRFSDGASAICDGDHLWTYRTNNERDFTRTDTLHDIMALRTKVFVPVAAPVEYPHADLPIDPYTLGVLLGDGCFSMSSMSVSGVDQEIFDRLELQGSRLVPTGCGCDYRISGRQGVLNPIKEAIRSLGLLHVGSHVRFVPEPYRYASVEQRMALLRGLMDTDGTIDKNGSCEFSTSSPEMAEHVAELVRSLGGVTGWNGQGIRIKRTTHRDAYRITVRTPFCPFSISRKAQRWKPPLSITRSIREVVPADAGQAVCISVAAPDQLYLTSGYVVTHNTIFLLNMMQRMLMVPGQENLKFLFLSLEQTRGEWWERARRIHRFYNLDSDDSGAADFWRDQIMIVDKNRLTPEQIRQAIDDFDYRMGQPPDVIALDYIGYFAQSFKGERYERTSDAVMGLKEIAKDTRCRMVAPHQVSRMAKDGEEFGTDAARDSGAIEETSDFLFNIWSPDNTLARAEEEKQGIVSQRIAKSRNGSRGLKIDYRWGPLSLVMVPTTDPLARFAQDEMLYNGPGYRDDWPTAVWRHQTGIKGATQRPGMTYAQTEEEF
jgi:replicative DNA helicase